MLKMTAFDLDGTICDSIPMCMEAFCKAVTPYTDHTLTEKEVINTFGLNEIGMVKAVVKNNWESALSDFYKYYEELHDMCATPFTGIPELLTVLKQNHIRVPLITGKGERSCKITLQKIGLYNMFDEILYGYEEHSNKKESLLFLMQKYEIQKNELFYIGDAAADINACKSIEVICLSAAWQKFNNIEILKEKNSSYTFENVKQLRNFLDKELSNMGSNPLTGGCNRI